MKGNGTYNAFSLKETEAVLESFRLTLENESEKLLEKTSQKKDLPGIGTFSSLNLLDHVIDSITFYRPPRVSGDINQNEEFKLFEILCLVE